MEEQAEFFSPNHKRLLSIATWAKYLAWVVLLIYIFYAFGAYTQEKNQYFLGANVSKDFAEYLTQNLTYGFSLLIEMVGIFLKGIVYFLVLKAVSLGLNMVVETDINYREKKAQGGGQ